MSDWYSRTVFFVKDAGKSIEFYRDKLSCTVAWEYREGDRVVVCQVGRPGFEVILAAQDEAKSGHGRVFIEINRAQEVALRKEIEDKSVAATDAYWGMPVILMEDPDGNQVMFSPPSKGQ